MTRRGFLWAAATSVTATSREALPLVVPIHRVVDSRARCTPLEWRHFWESIWPQAFRDFAHGGMRLQTSDATGEIKRSPGGRPIFTGLRRGVINLVLTDAIPLYWDRARSLAGATARYDGYHICVLALRYAHGHGVPYLAANTCVHELLHALLQDVYLTPTTVQTYQREWRDDWYATQLWLFHDGGRVRASARQYLGRLRAEPAA